jgi:hypothetical protein
LDFLGIEETWISIYEVVNLSGIDRNDDEPKKRVDTIGNYKRKKKAMMIVFNKETVKST